MVEEVKGGAKHEDNDCSRCDAVFSEVMNSFRVAVERMKDLAAKGKGQEYEAEHNPQYNRYFGCAIAMDTILREYFADRLPKEAETKETATATVEVSDAVN